MGMFGKNIRRTSEICIGETVSPEYDDLCIEFEMVFCDYIAFQSGFQSFTLNNKFIEEREVVSKRMESFFLERGLTKGAGWSFQ